MAVPVGVKDGRLAVDPLHTHTHTAMSASRHTATYNNDILDATSQHCLYLSTNL